MLTNKNFGDIVTFTRASARWRFSNGGVLVQDAANVPSMDYDPATLAARGMLIEEARTNAFRNNSMAGAVAGAPGTLPTYWSDENRGTLSRTVVAIGTEYGMPYMDLRLNGTTSTVYTNIQFDATVIAAAQGQTWVASMYCKLVGGSLANVSAFNLTIGEFTSAAAYLTDAGSGFIPANGLQRATAVRALSNASTAYAKPWIAINYASGVAIDFTLRIYAPQFEQSAFPSSPILTTTAQVTRAADNAIITDLSKIGFNASEGTLYAEATLSASGSNRVLTFSDGTTTNQIWISASGCQIYAGGATQANWPQALAVGTHKVALAYKAGDAALSIDGAAAVGQAPAAIPPLSRLIIGQNTGSAAYLNGWLRNVRYIPRRMTNAELQNLTA